jgi:hypothetical protein
MQMTKEQKRIKIAEACGLQVIDVPFIPSQTKSAGCVFTDAARTAWRKCFPNSCGVHGIPDYFNDLNAMHEAEKTLRPRQRDEYNENLETLVGPQDGWQSLYMWHATAAQRAESFLKTLNLLTE